VAAIGPEEESLGSLNYARTDTGFLGKKELPVPGEGKPR
jgi:hypothetical protein